MGKDSDGEEHGERVEEKEEKPSWQLFKMTILYGCPTLPLAQPLFDLVFAVPKDGQQSPTSSPATRSCICLIPTHQQACEKEGMENAGWAHVERPAQAVIQISATEPLHWCCQAYSKACSLQRGLSRFGITPCQHLLFPSARMAGAAGPSHSCQCNR